MSSSSRRAFLAAGCTAAGLGLVGSQVNGFTKEKIAASLSPLPGIRATGKPLDVQTTVEDTDAEYLPKTNEVRVVTARNSSGAVAYATEPFEQWGEMKAGGIAIRRVQRRIEVIFDDAYTSSGLSSHDGDWFVSTAPTGPGVTQKEMVRKLPDHVTVTMTFAGQTDTTSIPGVVEKRQEAALL
ncbi:hypothetical protein [Haladaptatus sp.]|uniref:hypothetical protein n=1 Tax=Haladaptatus sp. TaxID=1973141 RepID=UPI003C5FB611